LSIILASLTTILKVFDLSNVKYVSPEELARMQQAFRRRDLAQRSASARLEDVVLIRARDARLIKPAKICFDDDLP
jgi:hypothetical protein